MQKNKQNEIKRHHIIVILLGAIAGMAPFTIDMYLPGFPHIVREFQTTMSRVGLTLTSYFIGLSIGQLLSGPLLDRFGRKRPLIVGFSIYILAAIGCAFSPNIYFLIILRFFLALGVCVGMVGGSSIVRDLFKGREVARAFSLMGMVFGIAPVIAPTIGGIVVSALGWRYVFGVLTAMAVFVFITIIRVLPETKGPDKEISLKPAKVLLGYRSVLKERQFVIFALANMVAGGGLFSFITNSPFLLINVYGFTSTQFGWIFGINALTFVIAGQVNRILLRKFEMIKIVFIATGLQLIAGILLTIGTLTNLLPVIAVLILMACYWFFFGLVTPNSGALALQPFTKNVGSASALMGCIQMFAGASTSALVSFFNNGTAVPVVLMMFSCSLISFILFRIGAQYVEREK